MKICLEPKVYLVGLLTPRWGGLESYLRDHGHDPGWTPAGDHPEGETPAEVGGRVCYDSFRGGRGHPAYIAHILDVGHGSVLEHAVAALIVAGVSRSLSHELVRHRVGISPSQRSQRYCDESGAAVVPPPAIARDDGLAAQWLQATAEAFDVYAYQVAALEANGLPRKAAREAARSVLPNATETHLYLTLNARAARHLLALRGGPAADAEMRRLSVAIYRTLAPVWPHILADVIPYTVPDVGTCLRVDSEPRP